LVFLGVGVDLRSVCITPGATGGTGSRETLVTTRMLSSSATSAKIVPSCGMPSQPAGPLPM
jgi:hypothetical protein